MGVAATFAVGGYQVGEGSLVIRGRLSKPATDKLIIVCHGRAPSATNACLQWTPAGAGASPHLLFLAEHGYTAVAIDAGGDLTWGNDASVTAVGNAVSWARTQGYCHPTAKVILLGYSMGGAVSLNYLKNNLSGVAGWIGEAPATNIDYFYADSTYTAEIDAAYGGNYSANGTGHSPIGFAGSITTPTRVYHASDDGTVPISQSQTWINSISSTDKALITLPGGGHTNFWQYIDQQSVLQWLGSLSY